MHVSVTALGASPDRTRNAANDIVNYLEGGNASVRSKAGSAAAEPQLGASSSPGSYYSDSPEQAGRWRGDGTADLGSTVEPETFRRALLGQHPITGEQLVSAAGSSARAKHLPKGLPAGDPNELMTLDVAADAIGVDVSYLRRLARESTSRSPAAPPPGPGEAPPARPKEAYLDAEKVGNRWMVTRAEIERFISARNQPQVVMAYDITFSAPKSLSILWAAGDTATRQLCEEAFEAGVARGVEYLERNAIYVGRQADRRPAGEMIAASYRHSTNRELEPQLHEHVVIANMGRTEDGQVRALDSRSLFANATTAGYLAEAEMQHHCNQLGIGWTDTRRGIANVAGVPDEAIRAMSTRREQILNLTAELGTDSALARQKAALATRASKETSVDLSELRERWVERLARHGFGTDQLAAAVTAEPVRRWTDADTQRLDRHLSGPTGVTEQQAIFDRRDVIQTIVDHAGGRLTADQVEQHADRWLHTDAAIPLTNLDHRHVDRNAIAYTTPAMVRLESAIADGYESGHDAEAAIVPSRLIDAAIANWEATTGHRLGDDQAAMVRSICGSGDRFQAVVGPAGSGKTAALEVAARAWESAGYTVVGAAVNGTAAEVLERSTGVPSRTVAGLVTRLDTADRQILQPNTVVLVDEASTLGNRQHARLVHHVSQAGAAMRAIGDPTQHGAVEAGGMWAHLVTEHADRTPILTENRRQNSPDMTDVRLANTDYRAGRIAEAIARLETNQRIVTAASSGELLDQLAADWYVDRSTNPDAQTRMIAEHHRERRALNARAQQLLRHDGTLTGPSIRIGDAAFHVGDEVIARAPNRQLHPADDRTAYIRNGTTGTVTAINGEPGAENLTVNFTNRGEITVPHEWLTTELRPGLVGGLAPAYAVTSHAAQGDTYRTGRIVATDTASTEAVYVGLTRGTHDARIYTVRSEPHTADTDPRLPRIEDPRTEIEALTDQLSKQHGTELATVANADIDRFLALSRLTLPELASTADPLTLEAEKIVEQRIRFDARSEPDPAIVEHIGPRPTDKALGMHWDSGVEAAAVYEARWNADALGGVPVRENDRQRAEHVGVNQALRASRVASLTERPTAELAETRDRLVRTARSGASQRQDDMVARVDDIDAALALRIQSAIDSPAKYVTETIGERPANHSDRWTSAARSIETYRHTTLGIEPSAGSLDGNLALGRRPQDPLQAEAWTSAHSLLRLSQSRAPGVER